MLVLLSSNNPHGTDWIIGIGNGRDYYSYLLKQRMRGTVKFSTYDKSDVVVFDIEQLTAAVTQMHEKCKPKRQMFSLYSMYTLNTHMGKHMQS